ncbi:hypothetical protein [Streptomyces sp. NBC_01089]|uniref:hypothetical protein n=1 Tax=Streptomyces sp. NBC_01089 TaxID=2903747 RepID=UPI0038675540|nr:hypothetical protein OG510_08565 [Streptomyces sp. NBC_01089]
MLEEHESGEADHVRGGLVARDEQKHGQADEFVLAELAGHHSLDHEPAEQIVGGRGPLGLHQAPEEAGQGAEGLVDLRRTGVPVHDHAAVVLEEVMVGVRDAEQVTDRHRRYRQRELGHQVRRSTEGAHPLQRLDHRLLDQRLDPPDVLDHELGRQHPPEAAVRIAVHEYEQARCVALLRRNRIQHGKPGLVLIGTKSRMPQQLPHVFMPGD